MFITFHRSLTRLYVQRATHTLENYKKLKPDLFRESSVWTWAVFNIHLWCSHSHCLQRIRTLLVSARCPQGRISALGVAGGGRKLWEMTMICQICGKVAVMSVMGTNRSIYLFTPERPRDLSARAPGPTCQEYYNIITRPQICLGKKLSKTINPR